MTRTILFIGGSGVISAPCVRRAVARGDRVSVLNRGRSGIRPLPGDVEQLIADATDAEAVAAATAGRDFDVVAQFRAFVPTHVAADVATFAGRIGQYVFVSSASAYCKPPQHYPILESTPLKNPFWRYSRDKIACEDLLVAAHRDRDFPATIVRPSHTYDETLLPTLGGWTDVARMRAGKPVVVHGDGTTPWTLTHADDVAVGLTGLLGNPQAIGEAFTITGTHAPTWDQIYTWLGRAAGVEPELVHVASETIAVFAPDLGPGLVGDKAFPMVYDCSKIKALIPEFGPTISYAEAVHDQIAWCAADPARQRIDPAFEALSDRLVTYARSAADLAGVPDEPTDEPWAGSVAAPLAG